MESQSFLRRGVGVASWDLCLYGADRSSMAAHCPLAKGPTRHFYSSQMVNPIKHHPSLANHSKTWFLVGGFNPLEKYSISQNGSLPHGSWWKYIKKRLKPPPRFDLLWYPSSNVISWRSSAVVCPGRLKRLLLQPRIWILKRTEVTTVG